MVTYYLIREGELKVLDPSECENAKAIAEAEHGLYIISNYDKRRDYKLYYGAEVFEIGGYDRAIYPFLVKTIKAHDRKLKFGHAIDPDEWLDYGNIQFYFVEKGEPIIHL